MRRILISGAALLVAGSAAFAALGWMGWLRPPRMFDEKGYVRNRVEAYWEARVQSNQEELRRLTHPLQKVVLDPGMVNTEIYELVSLEVDGDQALATVRITARIRHPILSRRVREVTLEEPWVRYEGDWYKDVAPVGFADLIDHMQGQWKRPEPEDPHEMEVRDTDSGSGGEGRSPSSTPH